MGIQNGDPKALSPAMRAVEIAAVVCACFGADAWAFGPHSVDIPHSLLGTWQGVPSTSILGPWSTNLTVGIARAKNLDYFIGQNVNFDASATADLTGWQRFYLESTGAAAGRLWYCGVLSRWINPSAQQKWEQTDFDTFVTHVIDDKTVSFCFNESNPKAKYAPFPASCTGCDCAKWTLALQGDDAMTSTFRTYGGTIHLQVSLKRVGPPPALGDAAMPSHRADDASYCNFSANDGKPNNFSSASLACPFLRGMRVDDTTLALAVEDTTYPNCFELNAHTGYRLEWALQTEAQPPSIRVRVSGPTTNGGGYVAVGFRPLSRVRGDPRPVTMGTGSASLFGMQGADVVLGHGALTLVCAPACCGHGAPPPASIMYTV